MKNRHRQDCPVAAMMNVFGDRWSWLIIREALYGATRFKEFEANTGIAKNLLADRLSILVDEGILKKTNIGQSGTRYAYSLTAKGKSLETILIAMSQWGNEHIFGGAKAPVQIVERQTGKPVEKLQIRSEDGRQLTMKDLAIMPGSKASKATRHRLSQIDYSDEDTRS